MFQIRFPDHQPPELEKNPMLQERMDSSLTFDDVLLIPEYSDVLPHQCSIQTRLSRNLSLNIPLVSAAMDTVTEFQTAISMAQEGGIGTIHKNMSIREQANHVEKVKRSESGMITDPITVSPEQPVRDAMELMQQHQISGVPVTRGKELVGILTNRDLRFETNFEQQVAAVMTRGRDKLITVSLGIDPEEAKKLLHRHRIEKLLVVSSNYELEGLITIKDIEKSRQYPNANKDEAGRLRVAVSRWCFQGYVGKSRSFDTCRSRCCRFRHCPWTFQKRVGKYFTITCYIS